MSLAKLKGPSVLITGAGGYIGRQVVKALSEKYQKDLAAIVATDIREVSPQERLEGMAYLTLDIRSPELRGVMKKYHIDTVVHLAAIVTPDRKSDRQFEYSVDVLGTKNVLDASLAAGVRKLIITSSGAAYGYYPDNPDLLDEQDALRGNPEFAYSDHKRQVEEMLAQYREAHPGLKQLIFRPGTILGVTADNQITALFDKPVIMGLRGSDSPSSLFGMRMWSPAFSRGSGRMLRVSSTWPGTASSPCGRSQPCWASPTFPCLSGWFSSPCLFSRNWA